MLARAQTVPSRFCTSSAILRCSPLIIPAPPLIRIPDGLSGLPSSTSFVPLFPMISIVCCFVLMLSLPLETWVRFVVWLIIGLFIYFGYSRKRVEDAA